ncbi:hypothetical protein [Dactylosporangium sp. NPDC051541]|uniref:hypothetical protein n=1 Tax=Dactylosporangium sp. NPDC051541 TaxID=3363977 RepID=UPI00378BFE40
MEDMEPVHRSEPVVIASGDGATALYLYRTADPDGTGEFVTVAKLEAPPQEVWYLTEPIGGREILIPHASADAARNALAALA